MHGICLHILLSDWDDIGRKSWGSGCLAWLYRELCRATSVMTPQISGPTFILHIWAWEHLLIIAPPLMPSLEWEPIDPQCDDAYGVK
ncbi:unnamed protein product [Linum trigynum]|uniref:Aminotransferase-like plant mobile domain-containing protein n=1 Tax=Linum trigynum TaxID=586398 RepID=A0AAV2CMB8_9ROSI